MLRIRYGQVNLDIFSFDLPSRVEFTKIVANETEEKIDESLDLVYREPTESGGDGVRRIVDEFTDLKISRQRKWQLRRAKEGKCIKCGAAAAPGSGLCVKHNVETALYHHQRNNPGKKPSNSKWLKLASYNASYRPCFKKSAI